MAIISTFESLSSYLESFAEQMDEIEAWISGWRENDRIKANVAKADYGMTKKACIMIIVSAQAVHDAVHFVETVKSQDLPKLLANGIGMNPLDWISVLEDRHKAKDSPIENQLRIVRPVLRVTRKTVRDFARDKLLLHLRSGALGHQARLGLQHYVAFHLEQMEDGFLMLQAVLLHGLDRRLVDVAVMLGRIERDLSRMKSSIVLRTESQEG